LGGLNELDAPLIVAPFRPVAHARELRQLPLELPIKAGGQRRGRSAPGDLLLGLQRLRQPPGAEVLLQLAEEAADLVPVRGGGLPLALSLFLRRGARRRNLAQFLANTVERACELSGCRVAGKPRRALARQVTELLAKCRSICLR